MEVLGDFSETFYWISDYELNRAEMHKLLDEKLDEELDLSEGEKVI